MKIGAFSAAVKISKRMLRYYDEKGLLCPRIDDNGYRVYSAEHLERAGEIVQLRDMGFTIQEMKAYIEADASERERRLYNKADALTVEAEENQEALHLIQMRLDKRQTDVPQNTYTVMRGNVPERCVVSIVRRDMPMGQFDDLFTELDACLNKGRHRVMGKPFGRIHDTSEHEQEVTTIEVGMPVQCGEQADIKIEPACEVLEVVHCGPYENLLHAYTALYTFAERNGLEIIEPITEIYVTDSWVASDPSDYVTIVQGKIRS